jgi:DNA-directed RNA polymerase subunit E'/Rpb7
LIKKYITKTNIKLFCDNILNMTNEQPKIFGVYSPSILTTKITLPIVEVGQNIKRNLEQTIINNSSGKCIAEGFIKNGSIKILNYSCGTINNGRIEFQVVFECMICHPVEGMIIDCTTKTITKAGIHAEVIDDDGIIPITVFIARDHHYTNKLFSNITENTKITASVIGVRYELNDPCICVIAKLNVRNLKPDKMINKNKSNIGILED